MTRAEETLTIDRQAATKWLTILIIMAVVGAGWLWWSKVYTSADNVFWGMISNNLASGSVTRHTEQSIGGQTTDQYIEIELGSVNAAHSVVTVSQQDKNGPTVVKSETIGTPSSDYSRYISIKTPQKNAQGKPLNTAQIIGLWGKTPDAKPGQRPPVQYLQQSLLGIVPFASLTPTQRHDLVRLIRDDNVYNITGAIPKSTKLGGHPVFIYTVSINPQAYIGMLQQFTKDIGLGDIGLDPSQYASSQPLKTEFTLDKASRQLVRIVYPGTGQSETFSAQGLERPIALPMHTIPIAELQAKVQNIR